MRPAFTDHFLTELRLGRIDPVGPGAAARFRLGDSWLRLDTVIERVERPYLIREAGRGGRANRVGVFTVWEIASGPGPDTSEVTLTFWTEPANVFDRLRELRISKRKLRRGWTRALRRLRDLAESGEQPARVGVAGSERVAHFVA